MPSPLAALAMQAYRSGRHAEAASHCQAILRTTPGDLGALQMLGALAQNAGRLDEALLWAEKAAAVAPDDAAALGMLGALRLQQGQNEPALVALTRACALQPRNAALQNSRAGALQALGRWAETLKAYDKSLAVGDPHPEALLQRGHVLMALKQPVQALASYNRVLALRPDFVRAFVAQGAALLALGRSAEAVKSFQDALAAAPGDGAAANNLAIALQHLGRDDDALKIYERILSAASPYDPAYFGRAKIHLAHARFSSGWDDHRARHSVRDQRALLFQGRLSADLEGESLWLRKDQGIGDELFFLRFVPTLKLRGPRIIYQAGAKIAPIIRRLQVADEVIDEDALIPDAAMVLSIGDLPYALGHADRDPVPGSLALTALPARLAEMATRLRDFGSPPYIGVAWRAGTTEHAGLYKEISMGRLAEALSSWPGTIMSLQRLPEIGEVEAFAKILGRPVFDGALLNDDMEGMLALLSLLDEHVCVSNTNVHLRALAGLPSRVLVPMPPDWRWMHEGDESPWFSGTRIYRQAADGGWDAALIALAHDLEAVFNHGVP